ncbi:MULTISPECIES: condensation domain-containing protein [unclassified Solwaraspora]|uniref:condensation domain-containing protein n=1 Tax=unclassified Solwaraspora TaxID=2627926 RepID=UPI00259B2FD7|nr:condensation domain-containing protein [Solwaraspora sp. WMMA2056]WJK40841.1 condensation domain-containing protein [Solwaraspora sp. WMMA2056]
MGWGAEVRRAPLGGAQQFEWWKLLTGTCNAITVAYRPDPPVPYDRAVSILRGLVARHEALRTAFRLAADGMPVQVVRAAGGELPVRVCDERTESARAAFRLALTEPPFTDADPEQVRFGVVRSAGDAVELLVVASHAVFDGYSERIVLAELAQACRMPGGEDDSDRPGHPDLPGPSDGPQPADSAWDEDSGELAAVRLAAQRFWHEEVRRIPSRLFVPLRPGVFQRYGASYRSAALPPALVLAARRHRTSPAVVYSALMHALLAIMSGAAVTVVRNHFAGRTVEERDTVGCYHCILPTTVDVSDRPSLGALIERLRVRTFQVQSRYRVGQLTLREMFAAEQRRRGEVIAVGTTINFDQSPELTALQQRGDGELTDLLATAGELEFGMGRNETTPDPAGFDAYLMNTVEDGAMWILASFNSMVLDPGQMRAMLSGPERILRAYLAGADLTLDEVAARLGTHLGEPALVDLSPGEDPGRPADDAVDQSTAAAGTMPGGAVSAVAALRAAVADLHELDHVDQDRCYLAAGGRLLLVPAVLARLSAAGWAGLVPDDFTTAVPLIRLARRLRPAR